MKLILRYASNSYIGFFLFILSHVRATANKTSLVIKQEEHFLLSTVLTTVYLVYAKTVSDFILYLYIQFLYRFLLVDHKIAPHSHVFQ